MQAARKTVKRENIFSSYVPDARWYMVARGHSCTRWLEQFRVRNLGTVRCRRKSDKRKLW